MTFENLRIQSVRAVLRYRSDRKKWRAETRKDHIVGVQLHGAARHDFGTHSFVLSRNCVFFFNQRESYDVEVLEAGESFSIHFTTYEEIESESFCIPLANLGELPSILRRAELARGADRELALLSLTYRLCAEIERIREKTYSPKDARMVAAKEIIDGHMTEADCVQRAIRQSGVTPRRFGELFRNAFGVTPNRYLVTTRIERAKELLAVDGLTVTEVAELSGFSDVYYFSKVFKRETGVSPGRWHE